MSTLNKGQIGEQLVSNFFDKNFSKIYSFPNAKTKTNAEVADVLVWLNRTVFLIEVKTRDEEGTAPIQSWFHSQTEKSLGQIIKNFKRIKSKEQIFLHNAYYHTELDFEGLSQVIGLVVIEKVPGKKMKIAQLRLKSEAEQQLQNYTIDEKFKRKMTMGKTNIIKIALIFSGHELIDMGDVN